MVKDMAKEIDFKWLADQAQDKSTKKWIEKINKWRKFTLENNDFIKSDKAFTLCLGKRKLFFRKESAFSSIEIYQEIFKENNHFLVPDFSGRDASIVLDVGANEGFYSLKIAENNSQPKIFCVEPNPYVFEILKENIKINNIDNAVLINKAASSSIGKINFEIIKQIAGIGGKNLRIANRPWLKDEFITNVTVNATTLDALFSEYDISHVDILKIDVEGMELEVLHGCRKNLEKVKKIVVERHSKELRDKVVSFLLSKNFKVVFEEDPGFEQYYGDIYLINKNLGGGEIK